MYRPTSYAHTRGSPVGSDVQAAHGESPVPAAVAL